MTPTSRFKRQPTLSLTSVRRANDERGEFPGADIGPIGLIIMVVVGVPVIMLIDVLPYRLGWVLTAIVFLGIFPLMGEYLDARRSGKSRSEANPLPNLSLRRKPRSTGGAGGRHRAT